MFVIHVYTCSSVGKFTCFMRKVLGSILTDTLSSGGLTVLWWRSGGDFTVCGVSTMVKNFYTMATFFLKHTVHTVHTYIQYMYMCV